MNVSRRLPDGTVNPEEPNRQVICMTSAGSKATYAYDRLIDTFENSIIHPDESFTFGCDYRIPVLHGLLDKTYINKLKMSSSYSESAFASEYMSIWGGGSDESWFNFEKLIKHRKIKNPEKRAKNRADRNEFYLLSADVGRYGDQSCVCVWRVNINGYGVYNAALVNIIVLGRTPETRVFSRQAADIKELIRDFKPKEVVIDTNGIGAGIADEMIKPSVGSNGEILPAYGFVNDKNYKDIQPKDAICILYGIKAGNSSIKTKDGKTTVSNAAIDSNAYSRIDSGKVKFLIKEQEAKSALLSTKAGQRMDIVKRTERLLPHEMTTRLFEEMINLRLKPNSVEMTVERINPHKSRDKYSAMKYGLWRIKELEEESFKKKSKRLGGRKLIYMN